MKKIAVLMIILLLFCACKKEPIELPTVTTYTETHRTEEVELSIKLMDVFEVDGLPENEDNARLTGAPVGGNPRFFVFDEKMTYYVREYYDAVSLGEAAVYKCELNLPQGFENARITDVCGGAGSGEVIITVSAYKSGAATYLEYLFYCESLAKPEYVRELSEPFYDN